MPKRDRYLFVCTNRRPDGHPKGSCAESGAEALLPALKSAVATAKLALAARPCGASCLDVCWEGPVVLVMPDNVFFGKFTHEDIPALVSALGKTESVATAPGLSHKVLTDAQFDDPALVTLRAKKEL
ncbi:MAG: (2Fe-2S) ferredoxin domain-containing protein [Deltaproteobacteria bacterium]|nr:(2Fe-2S) ferredoxin domain-containing protein [Deltaproteobacteria bacterium]